MAGKHRKVKIERAPSKHQLSKWEKQKKLSRIIIICAVALIVALAGVIGVGIYLEQVAPYQQVVIKVNGVSYDYDYYIKMLDLLTKGQTDKTFLKYYTDLTANVIIQGQVVKEKAPEAGVTVSDDEINKEIETNKMPNTNVSTDLIRTRLLAQKYMKQICAPKQPKSVEQAEVQAMLVETEIMALDRKNKLLLGDNFTAMAASLSVEKTTQTKQGYLGWIPKGYESYALGTLKDTPIKDVIFKLPVGGISDPVYDSTITKNYGYWVLELLEKDDTKGVHARGILFGAKAQADMVREELKNGASWDEMARNYSQDAASKDKGGDLGWKVPGMDTGMLARMLSAFEVKQISDSIRDDTVTTTGGYWVIKVMDKGEKALDSVISQTLEDECLAAWVEGLMKDAKTENLLDQTQKDKAVEKVIKLRSK